MFKRNPPQPPPFQEAVLVYHNFDYEIKMFGSYVTCAVTRKRIPLDRLCYWSVDLQEPYLNAAAARKRMVDEN